VKAALALGIFFLFGAEPARAGDYPPFKVGLNTQFVSTDVELIPRPPLSRDADLKLRPAQSVYAGVILGYRWLGATVSFAIPAEREIRDVEGTSRYRDYRLSFYTTRFGAEAGYNRFVGYLIDGGSPPYTKLPSMETLGYGATVLLVPTPGNFSLAAAMDQSELQDKSGGAPVLLASWREQVIQDTAAWIPAASQASFGMDGAIHWARARSYAAGGGYAYNWVPGEFFVSGMMAVTLGRQDLHYQVAGDGRRSIGGAGNLHIRFGLGFNARSYFLVASAYADRYALTTSTIEIGSAPFGATFAGGLRF
jgi:hypothetical protein